MQTPPRTERVSLRFLSAALQRINEHNQREGYREARRRIQDRQNSEDDIRRIVYDFCGETIRL